MSIRRFTPGEIPFDEMHSLDDIVKFTEQERVAHSELTDIKLKAIAQAKKDFYTQFYRLQIRQGLLASIPKEDVEEFNQLQTASQNRKANNSKAYALFVTINPKLNAITQANFEALDKCVKKCLGKVWIKEYAYCYEQRGETEDTMNGLHCHIMINRNGYKLNHSKKEIKNTFKNIIGNDSHCDIKDMQKDWIPEKVSGYMCGKKTGLNKKGNPKELACSVDPIMRQQLNIKSLYSTYPEHPSF